MFMPCLSRRPLAGTGVEVRLGHELLDDYLRFVAARCRPNSVLAAGYDLKVFFTAVGKDPVEVTSSDVFDFIAAQRLPVRGGNVVRLADGEKGLSARTIARRLATLSGLYGYLCARGLVTASPVPTGLSVRRPGARQPRGRTTPLIRTPAPCPGFWIPPMPPACSTRYAPTVIGRWSWRCCSAVCVAARSLGYG